MAKEEIEDTKSNVDSIPETTTPVEDTPVSPADQMKEILTRGNSDIDRIVAPTKSEDPFGAGEEPVTEFEKAFNFVSGLPKGKSASEISIKRIKLALVKAASTPTEDIASFLGPAEEEIRKSDSSQGILDVYQSDIMTTTNDQFKQNMYKAVQSGVPIDTFSGISRELDKAQSDSKGLFATEKTIVRAFAGKTLSQSFKDDLSLKNYSASLVEDHFIDSGIGSLLGDFSSLIVHPLVNTIELRDVAIALDPEFSGNPWNAWTNTIIKFNQADFATKQAMVPKVMDALIKGHNNNQFQVEAGMAMLFNPDFVQDLELERNLEIAEGGLLLVAPLAGGFKLAKAIKTFLSPVSQLTDMKATTKAVELSKITESTWAQAANAHPSDWSKTVMGATESNPGLVKASQKIVDDIQVKISNEFKDLTDESNFIKGRLLKPEEQQKAIDAQAAVAKIDGRTTLSSSVLEHNNDGFKMQFIVESPTAGKAKVVNKEYTFVLDEVGNYAAIAKGDDITLSALIGGKVLSPDTILHKAADGIVDEATFLQNQASRLKSSLIKLAESTEDSLKALPVIQFKLGKAVFARRDARKQVNELLIAGDEAGEVFGMERAMSGGVETVSGKVSVSKEVYQAYLSKVAFNEEAWGVTNHLVRKSFEKLGVKEGRWLNSKTGNLEKGLVKVEKDLTSWDVQDSDLILAPGLGTKEHDFLRAGAIDIADALDNKGYQMVTLQNPIRVNNQVIKKALLPTSGDNGLYALPKQMIHKNAGYVTRIRKPGYYYAKDAETGKTYGVFKTSEAAESFGARLSDGLRENGEIIKIRAVRDQDFTKLDALDSMAEQHGGLIYSSRSSSKIFVDDAIEAGAERLSVGQSTQRMLENVTHRLAMDEFRMGAVKRWQNTARAVLIKHGVVATDDILRAIQDPVRWSTTSLESINDSKVKRMLEVQRDWMIDTLKIPLNEEKVWSKFMYDWASTMSEGKFRDAVVSIGSKNPVSAFKAAVFNPYLGFFNARQLFIQAQNASLAIAMHPIHAVTAVPEAMIQKLFLHMKEGTYNDLLKQSSKGIIPDKSIQDLGISLAQAKRSGIMDGINNIDLMGSTLSGFTSGSLDGLRLAAQKGRWFFEQGEQTARLISWNIARKNWIDKNPGKVMDDEVIEFLAKDTLRMNMNMQSSNAAHFQKGVITGPMTQFFQVQAKMVENTVGGIIGGGRWTKKEAWSAIAGQIVLYGTMGVPIVEDVTAWMTELTGNDPSRLKADSPNLSKAINQGMMGVVTNAMGFENNFSSDASLLMFDKNVVVDLAKSFKAMVSGEQGSIELKAPVFGIMKRTGDAMLDTYNAARAMFLAPSFATLQDGAAETLSGWLAITSAWSNMRRIRYAQRTGNLLTSKGTIIAGKSDIEGISGQSLVAAALGIKLDIDDEYYRIKAWEYDEKKAVRDTKKGIRKINQAYLLDRNFEKRQKLISAALAEWEGTSQRVEIEAAMIGEFLNPKSEMERQLQVLITTAIQTGDVEVTSTALANFYKQSSEHAR